MTITLEFIIIIILLVINLILISFVLLMVNKNQQLANDNRSFEQLNHNLNELLRQTRTEINDNFHSVIKNLGSMLQDSQDKSAKVQAEKLDLITSNLVNSFELLQKSVASSMDKDHKSQIEFNKNLLENQNALKEVVTTSLNNSTTQTEQKLENIRKTVAESISKLQDENSKKLDEMRNVVDEKLQKTLEERIAKSFSAVSERLEEVHKGLGEMQSIATGVGDLKKVLTNVKTRGILGEIQLQNIIEEIMSPEQYEVNYATKKGSANRVEFAIKLPGDAGHPVYLPIDAKFPLNDYHALLDAYDKVSQTEVALASKALETKIKSFAKDISDKYIDVPNTTEFAIMFLPIEGLYAEVVKLGLVETLQRDYKVNIAGPTTMAALLNSLQMGFRTLAIQEKSHEVWQVLGAVKTEFEKFGIVLAKTQERLTQANAELDKLVGTRTRAIQKKLRDVTLLDDKQTTELLDINLED